MKRMRATTGVLGTLLGVLVFCGACSHNSTTEPSNTTTTTTTTTAAAPTVTEAFNGTLPVAGFKFYTFNIVTNGTVNVTLTKVSGTGVPATVQLGIGIPGLNAGSCDMTKTIQARPGTTAQLTANVETGTYCAGTFDVGGLSTRGVLVTYSVAHP